MNKFILVVPVLLVLLVSSCSVEDVDSNVAAKIEGTYSISTYTTQTGPSSGDLSNNKVRVTRVDDTHAQIVIDYADPEADDVEASNAFVEKDGSNYKFSQTFSNASLSGTVVGNELNYELNYNDEEESFVRLTASK